jgi:hypothetical protein
MASTDESLLLQVGQMFVDRRQGAEGKMESYLLERRRVLVLFDVGSQVVHHFALALRQRHGSPLSTEDIPKDSIPEHAPKYNARNRQRVGKLVHNATESTAESAARTQKYSVILHRTQIGGTG